MPASLVQTIIRALTQLIGARQVRAVVCVALMVSANAATAQAPNQHFGAETIFRGCFAQALFWESPPLANTCRPQNGNSALQRLPARKSWLRSL